MGNGSSASNKNGALKETLGDHEERYFVYSDHWPDLYSKSTKYIVVEPKKN